MKKLLLSATFFLTIINARAQTGLLNGDFETWVNQVQETPGGRWTCNNNYLSHINPPDIYCSKVPGAINSAAHLETLAGSGNPQVGTLSNGFFASAYGGIPFAPATIPTHFNGKFRYNIKPGYAAEIYLAFKKNGTLLDKDTFYITGTQSSFTTMSFALRPLTATPDSIIISIYSGKYPVATASIGSYIEVDDLNFTEGSNTYTISDGNLDTWNTKTVIYPTAWYTTGNVAETTDKYSGSKAVKLVTQNNGTGIEAGSIRSTQVIVSTTSLDSLTGYYKYTPTGTDKAQIVLTFLNTSNTQDYIIAYNMPAASTYTFFRVPLKNTIAANEVSITISSSPTNTPVDKSTLFIDNLAIKSPSGTGTNISLISSLDFAQLFPNPVKDVIHVALKDHSQPASLKIFSVTGAIIKTAENITGTDITIPVQDLSAGLYFYEIKQGGMTSRNRFIKE